MGNGNAEAVTDATTAPVNTDAASARRSGPIMSVAPAPAAPPPGFVADVYDRTWTIERPRADVWAWLMDPATFTDGQIPPFRVEFLANEDGPGEFRPGVYNHHVGPLMCFAGVLGEERHQEYRDLQYFYGSYAVSHALFRPTRLQFWVEDGAAEGTTILRLQLDTFVRTSARKVWTKGMNVFWGRFGTWCEKAIPNNWLR